MKRTIIRASALGFILSALVYAFVVLQEYIDPSSIGYLVFFMLPVSLLFAIGFLLLALIPSVRRFAIKMFFFFITFAISGVALKVTGLEWQARRHAFARLADQSQPIIKAIETYTKNQGHPPDTLQSLVPRYLSAIPKTGISEYPEYEYSVFDVKKTPRKLFWYDLGTRGGEKFTGLWVYIEGNPGYAVLVFSVNSDGIILNAATDRMPAKVKHIPFDPGKWRAAGPLRMAMVRDMLRIFQPVGKPFWEVENRLGRPDGTSHKVNAPWELRVPCSWGILNWDVFFYWPTRDYPIHIYGGSVERIGDWAYVHE